MELKAPILLIALLTIAPLLFSVAKSENSGSVFFIDARDHHRYLRPSSHDAVQADSMSPSEVGAAVSVLLGLNPPASLSAASSSKLNEILMPNPFDRPRAVFMLEVSGVKDSSLTIDPAISIISNAIKRKALESDIGRIELPAEEVAAVSLDEAVSDGTDKELAEFAFWFGGSYVVDEVEALNGEMILPLYSGATLTLHMSKKADREFIASLLALYHNSQKAVDLHEDLSQGPRRPAELLMGRFGGLKALQAQDVSNDILNQGVEVLLVTLSKLLASMQVAYKDQIVAVILFRGAPLSEAESLLDVVFTSSPSARVLAETQGSPNATIIALAEKALVRKTLAWITGIILLISTFMGIYLLLNMPLTRDTLLYSNVKLD